MTLEGMQRKMSRLEERVSEINARLNELKTAKADYEKQIEELKTEQILYIVRSSKLSIAELAKTMEVGMLIKQSETPFDNVADLLGISENAPSESAEDTDKSKYEQLSVFTDNDFKGGYNNEM